MEPSDEDVMHAVRDGDAAQLGVLFERHHTRLFHFFCRMTFSPAPAEDLTQEVFLRMLKYRKTFRNDSRFTAWMFHIARNVRIDYARKQGASATVIEDASSAQDSSQSPGERLEQAQEIAVLRHALMKLPADKRELIVLARYQELQYSEIAAILGADPGAVKVRVHRALKQLREIFNELSDRKTPCTVKNSETSLRTI